MRDATSLRHARTVGSRGALASMLRHSAFGALAFSSALALAEEESVLRIDYSAPAECPGQAAFAAQMRARSGGVASTTEDARRMIVRIARERGQLVGHLTVRDVDGADRERTVTGESCAQVVAGLAFVAAVALAPNPETDASAPGVPLLDDAGPTVSPDVADAGPPDVTRGAEVRTPVEAGHGAAAGDAAPWAVSVGVDGQIVSGAGPTTLLAVPVFAEIASTSRAVLAPSARGRFERAGSSRRSAAGGADFTWTSGSVDLCPVAWSQDRFRSEGCLRTEAGTLAAEGAGLTPVRRSVRPWFSVGPVARVRWQLVRLLFLELEGSLAVPLVRDRFFVEPNVTLFRVPLAEVGVGFGAGITIW